MQIKLSDHFTYKKLIRFTFPTVVMMIFTSIYGVVDGFFVSNFVGKTPFAAINLIMPFLMVFSAFGFMVGTGGSALVAKYLGEGEDNTANRLFSLLIYISAGVGIFFTILGLLLLRPVAISFGAEGAMLENCVKYGSIILPALTFFMMQNVFQSFFVTAEKPRLGLLVTVAAGVTNIVLDALFVAVFDWGLEGAALATALSQFVGGVIPLFYFSFKNNSLLKLGRAKVMGKDLLKVCINGSSELLTNLSLSLVNMLYNQRLMEYAGENGVAAYGVIMYVNFIFISAFIGFSIGCAPVISFHFGANNKNELKSLLKKSLRIIGFAGLLLVILAELTAPVLAKIFVGYDEKLFELTKTAFMLYSISFLIIGINIFSSAFFTALNNGAVSAGISFSRTLLFQVASILLLPLLFGINGIWLSITVAELMALAVSVICFTSNRKKYGY